MITVKLKTNSLIVRIAALFMHMKAGEGLATTIGRKINLYKVTPENFVKNIPWLRHELQHVIQAENTRFFRLKYIWENITKGYDRNKYEVEAEFEKHSAFPKDMIVVGEKVLVIHKDVWTKEMGDGYVSYIHINIKFATRYREDPLVLEYS